MAIFNVLAVYMFVNVEEVQKLFSGQVATQDTVDVRIERVDTALARQQQLMEY